MISRPGYFTLSLVFLISFAGSALGQSPLASPDTGKKEVGIAQATGLAPAEESKTKGVERSVAVDEPKPIDIKSEVEAMRAENAAVRELLRKMEEQQKSLIEHVERLQKRLDDTTATNAQSLATTSAVTTGLDNMVAAVNTKDAAPATADPSKASTGSKVSAAKQAIEERYRDGIVIWETGDEARIPFLLKFNNNTQVRYLNTLSANDTYTDHLGVVREVHKRNDITVNRSMFILGGYVFDKRLRYSLTVWTSAGAASIVVAGNVGWQFNKALTITGGYTGVPGTRSLVNTFPFFTANDRSMADNFFRPGFTQGVWANGEIVKGLHYLGFVGNGLNTLNISATKIDPNLVLSGSLWWEPLGPYGEPGKSRNMYDDYFDSKKTRIRIGTAFTNSREDRFSNLDQSSPENTSIYNSDGVLAFSTGAFAPGVTVEKATYRMWAIDGGVKWNGFAVNGQYFMRWLSDFEADGPMPLDSTYDHGFELSASKFVIPKKVMLYGRGSMVFGHFRDSNEYAGGVRWNFLPTERIWLNAELMRVNRAPYSGGFTPYTAGMSGWAPMIQTVLAF